MVRVGVGGIEKRRVSNFQTFRSSRSTRACIFPPKPQLLAAARASSKIASMSASVEDKKLRL